MDSTSDLYVPSLSLFGGVEFCFHLSIAINVQGNSISLPSGQSSYAAIDTGTTLVGGPPEYISKIFAQIPGSSPGTGNFKNYYTYRAFLIPFWHCLVDDVNLIVSLQHGSLRPDVLWRQELDDQPSRFPAHQVGGEPMPWGFLRNKHRHLSAFLDCW